MIREYEDKDWPQVKVLYEKAVAEWKNTSGYDDEIWACNFSPVRRSDVSFGAVLSKGDEIQGYIIGYGRTDTTFFIESMYVLPAIRRTGLAGRLYGFFDKRIRGMGYRWAITGTSLQHTDMRRILRRLGFEPVEMIYCKRCYDGRSVRTEATPAK